MAFSKGARMSNSAAVLGWKGCAAAVVAAAVLVGSTVGAVAQAPSVDRDYAVLRGLDKITARVMRLEVPVGEAVDFGTLSITVRACRSTTPEQRPDNAAFLEVVDEPPGEDPRTAFSGWMFSSSPSVSAMDHAVYDVWVVRCADPDTLHDDVIREIERRPVPEAPPVPPPLPPSRAT